MPIELHFPGSAGRGGSPGDFTHSGGSATRVSFVDGGFGETGPTLSGHVNTDLSPFDMGWVPFSF